MRQLLLLLAVASAQDGIVPLNIGPRPPIPPPTLTPTSLAPTVEPSSAPSTSVLPTSGPSTAHPSLAPSDTPSSLPTNAPTISPTLPPTVEPTGEPTALPSAVPTSTPTSAPTVEPIPRPSSTPTLIPIFDPSISPSLLASLTPSLTPTVLTTPYAGQVCPSQADALHNCYRATGIFAECDPCVMSRFPDFAAECDVIESTLCEGVRDCPCDPCETAILAFLDCAFAHETGCEIDCPFEPEPSPAPATTMAPTTVATSSQVCSAQANALNECYAATGIFAECDPCVASQFPDFAAECDVIESTVCGVVRECPCDACQAELLDFLDCAFGQETGCGIDCPSPLPSLVPSPAPTIVSTSYGTQTCQEQANAMNECYTATGIFAECDPCVSSQFPDFGAECDVIESTICTVVTDCPCDACRTELLDFLDCALVQETGCAIDCPTPAPSLSLVPVAAPAQVCPDEANTLVTCYAATGSFARCDPCVAQRFPDFDATCEDISAESCLAIAECDCEDCAVELEDFLDCAFQEETGCGVECTLLSDVPSLSPSATASIQSRRAL